MRVGLDEAQVGMALARPLEHPGRKVHADADRRLERGQQVTVAAAKLEYPQARRHEEAIHVLEARVIRARGPAALAASGRSDHVPLRDAAFAVGVGIPTV